MQILNGICKRYFSYAVYSSLKDCIKENFYLTNVIKQKEKNE